MPVKRTAWLLGFDLNYLFSSSVHFSYLSQYLNFVLFRNCLCSLFLIFEETGFHIPCTKGRRERSSLSLLNSLRRRSCLSLYLLTAERVALNSSHLAFPEQRVLREHKYPGSVERLSHRQRCILASPTDGTSPAAPGTVFLRCCLNSALTLCGKNIS